MIFTKNREQETIKEFFEQVFAKKKLVRSYLFLGENKQEQELWAYELSKVLNCEQNRRVWLDKLNANQSSLFAPVESDYQEACGLCQNCQWLDEQSHPKTPVFVEPSGAKNIIQVEAAKELQTELAHSSEYFRVVVFKDASRKTLPDKTANVLLKTIEEAKPNTLFLFFAESRDSVLATIASRCQYLKFAANDIEIEEEELEAFERISDFLNSNLINDELERINAAQELAEFEKQDLLEAFSRLERDIAQELSTYNEAKMIFAIETVIGDLRSFVKTKAALKDFLDKAAQLKE